MPYCTIEEAWGQSFGKKKHKAKTFKIEEDKLAHDVQTPLLASYPNNNVKLLKVSHSKKPNVIAPMNHESSLEVNLADMNNNSLNDEFIDNLYKNNKNLTTSTQYCLENSANCNKVDSNQHLQNQYRKYIEYIEKLEKRITQLEEQLHNERKGRRTNNFYNIVLYIFAGVFIIFLLDCFVRLGKCLNTHGGLGATLKLSKQAAQRMLPTNLPLPTQPLPSNYFQPAQLNPLHKFTEYRY